MGDRDLFIHGGEVVDGSGAPRFRADVRVRDGRVVEVGDGLVADGEPEVNATGAVVAPGFIDSHAHTDAHVFWNPTLDPDPLHGVTTMLIGNCGLSLFPVTEATRATVSDLFAFVEDVPRDLFDSQVPWTWDGYDGYRDAVDAVGTGVNLAALVGHNPLRLAVMGNDARERAATASERRPWRRCSSRRWPAGPGACRPRSSTPTRRVDRSLRGPPTAPSWMPSST